MMGTTHTIFVRVLCHGHAPHGPMVHLIDLDQVSRFLSAYSYFGGDEQGPECIEVYVDSFVRSATNSGLSKPSGFTPP